MKNVSRIILKYLFYILIIITILKLLPIRYIENTNPLLSYAEQLKLSKILNNNGNDNHLIIDREISFLFDHGKLNSTYQKAVVIIALKLYIVQLEKYGISQEIRNEKIITRMVDYRYAYTRALSGLIGRNFLQKILGPELLSPAMIYEYIEKNKDIKTDHIIELLYKIEVMNSKLYPEK
jgi:hypothetical protein